MMRYLGILLISWALVGCASMSGHYSSSFTPTEDVVMHSYSDDLQNAFFKKGNNPTRLCLEPAPDVAVSATDNVSLSTQTGDSVGVQDGTSATSLGGRSGMALIAREMLYRACELSMNNNSSPEESIEIYERFLSSIEKISAHDAVVSSEEDAE